MTDAYKIGVAVALNNLVSAELARIGQEFFKVGKQADGFKTALGNIGKVGLMVGVAGAVIGVSKALQAGIDEARRFQNEVSRFDAMGFGDKATAQAVKAAESFDIMGQSFTENMRLIREATGVVGDAQGGIQLAKIGAKFETNMRNYLGDEGSRKASDMMMSAFKTAELRGDVLGPDGRFNLAKVTEDMNAMQQVFIASGGLVTPKDFLNFIKTGGAAAKGLSGEAFFFQEAHGIQETGGQRAGTSLMSNYQNLAMGRTTEAVINYLTNNELLDRSKVVMNPHTGKPSKMQPEALKNALGFLNSQFDYFEKNIEPMLAGLSKQEAIDRISQMSSNRTAMNRNVQFYLERENIAKAVRIGHQAAGVDDLYDRQRNNYQAVTNDLTAKWSNLLKELGTNVLPSATMALKGVVDIIEPLTRFAAWSRQDHRQGLHDWAKDSWLGRLHDRMTGQNPIPANSNSQPLAVTVEMKGDIGTIARGVTRIQVDQMSGVARMPGAFDGNMALRPVQ